ncbi:MAG: MBL fold metallo-hydrolase [Methylococcaceae bacterium]|nr:MBL fold metallo-hydrolase [Methylococcaceae bacterium]
MHYPKIQHHGAVNGVTGSCHELQVDADNSVLIDCGLFQGAENSGRGSSSDHSEIEFPLQQIQALLVTHCHIDHVGRIPYLLAAGFDGPIYCSEPTAVLLPLVLEDAVKIGFSRNKRLVEKFLKLLTSRIVAIPYGQWQDINLSEKNKSQLKIEFNPAGHILGSAYIVCEVKHKAEMQKITFSGDLGGSHTPLLPEPKSPEQTDVLVIESTYGDKNHVGRKERKTELKNLIIRCLQNKGTILIPAFSIGRTQELLYELEEIIHQNKNDELLKDLLWDELEIIVDSPLASRFTKVYKTLQPFWDKEATVKTKSGRHPLSFEQLTTINGHEEHLATVEYLKKTGRPCVVLAASGMCAGGRVVNYLKAMIEDKRTDILFVGYQARGTPGRAILHYADKNGYVEMDRKRYTINAGVYSLQGYSAHADQSALINFVQGIKHKPKEIRIIHGDNEAKQVLQKKLKGLLPEANVWIPDS